MNAAQTNVRMLQIVIRRSVGVEVRPKYCAVAVSFRVGCDHNYTHAGYHMH